MESDVKTTYNTFYSNSEIRNIDDVFESLYYSYNKHTKISGNRFWLDY